MVQHIDDGCRRRASFEESRFERPGNSIAKIAIRLIALNRRWETQAMANVYYKDRLIVAYASFQQSTKLWSGGAEITWKTAERRHSHTLAGFSDRFKTSEEAE